MTHTPAPAAPEHFDVQAKTMITKAMARDLKEDARRNDRSESATLRHALRRYLADAKDSR